MHNMLEFEFNSLKFVSVIGTHLQDSTKRIFFRSSKSLKLIVSNLVSTKFPLLMATMEKWRVCVGSLSNDDIVKLQERVTQVSNLARREVSKRL